MKSGLYAKVLC